MTDFADHPENDLHTDSDHSNRQRPAPRNFEELLAAPDPAKELSANKRSSVQAVVYLVAAPLVLFAISALSAWLLRSGGGPLCEAEPTRWLCTRNAQVWWPIGTSALAFFMAFFCGVMMVLKLNRFQRWWPWMAVFWVHVPLAMWWMIRVLPVAILGHELRGF